MEQSGWEFVKVAEKGISLRIRVRARWYTNPKYAIFQNGVNVMSKHFGNKEDAIKWFDNEINKSRI